MRIYLQLARQPPLKPGIEPGTSRLTVVRSILLSYSSFKLISSINFIRLRSLFMNPTRVNRTPDQLIYSQPLCQLSYHWTKLTLPYSPNTHDGTRTHNPLIRSQMRYPLRHAGFPCSPTVLPYRAPRSRLLVLIQGPLGYGPNTLPLRQVAISVLPFQ